MKKTGKKKKELKGNMILRKADRCLGRFLITYMNVIYIFTLIVSLLKRTPKCIIFLFTLIPIPMSSISSVSLFYQKIYINMRT